MSSRNCKWYFSLGGTGHGQDELRALRAGSPNGLPLERTSIHPTCIFHVSGSPIRHALLSLVIAVMALVTYILLAALYSGLNSRWHPEILGVTASKALAVVLLDFLFVRGGCYFLNIQVCPTCRNEQIHIVTSSPVTGDKSTA